jgi:hypothetical protein
LVLRGFEFSLDKLSPLSLSSIISNKCTRLARSRSSSLVTKIW